jgi:hypothetical protein
MAGADYFPSRRQTHSIAQARWDPWGAALYIAKQNSRLPPSSAALRPLSLALGGADPVRPPPLVATKAAMSAADPTKGEHHADRA